MIEARLDSSGAIVEISPDGEILELDGLPRAYGAPRGDPAMEENLPAWRGHFAFAIFDPTQRELRAYRDHYGARPLYYCRTDDRLLLSSSIPQILSRLPEPPRLDAVAVRDYLAHGAPREGRTFHEGLRRLPAASRLIADRRGLRVERYWSPWDEEAAIAARRGGAEGRRTRLRELIADAVRDALADRFPTAYLLSGGPDSSALLGMASALARSGANASPAPRAALTLSFEKNVDCDEGSIARETAALHGVPWLQVPVEAWSPIGILDEFIERHGEPPGTINLMLEARLFATASAAGATSVVDGHDADALFTPSAAYFSHLVSHLRWIRCVREVVAMNRLHAYSYARVARAAIAPLARAMLWRRDPRSSENLRGTQPFGRAEAERILAPAVGMALEATRTLERMHGVEGRHPYFDPALVRFVLAAPMEERYFLGKTKIMLREGLADLYTPRVRNRLDKTNYTAYVDWALRSHAGDDLRVLAERGSLALAGPQDRQRAGEQIREYLGGRGAHRSAVWRMLATNRFLLRRGRDAFGGEQQ